MAKAVYIGNNNSKKVKKMYLGNGTSHKVKKGYIGVDGVAKLFYSGATVWNKYNTNVLNTYYWNRYNRVTTYQYYWDRYNVDETTYYKWKRYNISTQTIYKWNKYSVSYPSSIVIPSRPNELFTADDTMTGFEIINNSGESIQLYDNIPYFYDPSSIVIGFDSNGNLICDSDTGQPQLVTSSGYQYYAEYKFGWIVFPYDTYHYNSYSRYEHVFTINNKPGSNIALLWYTSGVMGYTVPVEYTKTLVGTVTSSNSNAYPNSGTASDGYYYEFQSSTQEQVQGSYIDDVENTNSSAYPQSGVSGSYWYEYDSSRIEYSRGSANGSVNSTNRSAYPDDGKSGNYWYVYDRQTAEYSQGSYINQVSSTDRGAYPDNNYSGNYWYVYDHMNTTYSQGSYIGIVENDDPNAYPDNGRHTDGYWYVKQNE